MKSKTSMRRFSATAGVVIALALAWPAVVSAKDKEAAKRLLDKGNSAYGSGDLKGALQLFQDAYRAYPSPKIQKNIGLVHEKLGSYAQAYTSYLLYLQGLGPEADPQNYTKIEAARDRLQAHIGRVLLVATVGGAKVRLDGRTIGTTPLAPPLLAVTPGKHQLQVTKPGYVREEKPLDIAAGELRRITFNLRPLTQQLTVRSTPSGAAIVLDGKRVGTTPLVLDSVRLGRHRITASVDGYRRESRDVHLEAAKPGGVHLPLSRAVAERTRGGRPTALEPGTEAKPRTTRVLAWTTVGLAAALAVAGTSMMVLASNRKDELDGYHGAPYEATIKDAYDATRREGETFNTAGVVLLGTAGAAAAVSAVLFLVGRNATAARSSRLRPGMGSALIMMEF